MIRPHAERPAVGSDAAPSPTASLRPHRRLATAAGLACIGGAMLAAAQNPAPSTDLLRDKPVVLINCPVLPHDDVKVAARVSGVLSKMLAQEGTVVKKGQQLAQIDDLLASIELRGKKIDAEDESPVNEAAAREVEATAKVEDGDKLRRTKSISNEEMRILQAQLEIAKFQVDGARTKMEVMKSAAEAAAAQLEYHKIRSPVDGVVVQRVKQEGESVEALEPVLRVIAVDRVKIEAAVNVRYADRVRAGQVIDVFPNMTEGDRYHFRGHSGEVNAVKVLANGVQCVSAGADGSIIVWNLSLSEQERVLTGHEGSVNCLALAPSEPTKMISGGADKMLRIWDLPAGKTTAKLPMPSSSGAILAAVFHPADANICVTSHEDRSERIWDLKAGKALHTLTGHNNYATSLNITPDGKMLVTAGNDRTVRVWGLAKGELLHTYPGRWSDVRQLGIAPDGKSFLFNISSLLQIRTLPDDFPIASFEMLQGTFADVAVFAPTGGLVLTANDNHQLLLWEQGNETQHARVVRTYVGHEGGIRSVDFAPNGGFFVSGGVDRTVRLWKVPAADTVRKERKRGQIKFV
ncbi:MAG: efflux RND transporter periplasmic adaptor subunit, partial [Planctomycetia bacterium]